MDNQDMKATILAFLRGSVNATVQELERVVGIVEKLELSDLPAQQTLARLIYAGQVVLGFDDGVLIVDHPSSIKE